MKHDVKECPNCKENRFGGLGADGGSTSAALISADRLKSGEVKLNTENVLLITPLICENCNYVMLFKN